MNKSGIRLLMIAVVEAAIVLLTAFYEKPPTATNDQPAFIGSNDRLKKEAFEILDTQCNGCHRAQNPFRVLTLKNTEKHAFKIYKMVFLEQRMPRGDEIRLSDEEYTTLEKWLVTQKILTSWKHQ